MARTVDQREGEIESPFGLLSPLVGTRIQTPDYDLTITGEPEAPEGKKFVEVEVVLKRYGHYLPESRTHLRVGSHDEFLGGGAGAHASVTLEDIELPPPFVFHQPGDKGPAANDTALLVSRALRRPDAVFEPIPVAQPASS